MKTKNWIIACREMSQYHGGTWVPLTDGSLYRIPSSGEQFGLTYDGSYYSQDTGNCHPKEWVQNLCKVDGVPTATQIKDFIAELERDPSFIKFYGLAMRNAPKALRDKIYLVGSRVYSILSWVVNGTPHDEYSDDLDYDFLLPRFIQEEVILTDGFEDCSIQKIGSHDDGEGYTCWRIIQKDGAIVDLIDMMEMEKEHKLSGCTLNDYLKAVPLTVQSIAYDPAKKILIGKGVRAALLKIGTVNNQGALHKACNRKYIGSHTYISEKMSRLFG